MSGEVVLRLNSDTSPIIAEERAILEAAGLTVVEIEGASDEEIAAHAPEADAVMVVSAYLRGPVIEKLTKCRIISRMGTGVDKIDVQQATRQGVVVTNLPDFSTNEVADHTMALLLSVARRLKLMEAAMREGRQPDDTLGIHRLSVLNLGLCGFGRIGRAVAQRAKAFGMTIYVYDPFVTQEVADAEGVTLTDLDTVLESADYLALLCPLTAETRGMISARELHKMKPTAVIVNTGRGDLIVEDDLIEALRDGTISFAALDVFSGINVFAPGGFPTDHPFFSLKNVILTPHFAAASEEAKMESVVRGAQAVVDVLSGKKPANPVNDVGK